MTTSLVNLNRYVNHSPKKEIPINSSYYAPTPAPPPSDDGRGDCTGEKETPTEKVSCVLELLYVCDHPAGVGDEQSGCIGSDVLSALR